MALTRTEFLASFPEFAAVDGEIIDLRLSAAARMMDPDFFGDLFADAQGYYAAHLLTTLPPGVPTAVAAGGGAVEVAAGSARVRFREGGAVGSGASGYYAEYMRIVRALGQGPWLAQVF